jgi:hypothetical protein
MRSQGKVFANCSVHAGCRLPADSISFSRTQSLQSLSRLSGPQDHPIISEAIDISHRSCGVARPA